MILVIAEHDGNRIRPLTRELIAFARQASKELNQPTGVLILAADAAPLAAQLEGAAVDKIFIVEDPALKEYGPAAYLRGVGAAMEAASPYVVAGAHNTQGMDFMPRLAVARKQPLAPACVEIMKQGEALVLTRPVFNGRMHLSVSVSGQPPYLITVAPGAFPPDKEEGHAAAATPAEVVRVPADFSDLDTRRQTLDRSEAVKGATDLGSAEIIVSAGRGLKQKENLQIVFDLADALGGAVGASRPVVDAEWMARDHQIGSSGQTVSPRLYIAVGISGAVQHLVGMDTARCIVAINKDPDAPIFKISHYGIVDDLFKVVPALTRVIRELKSTA